METIKWIKITTNMFDDEKIKLIDAMPERDTIFYIWMRLLVQAGKTNAGGFLFLSENVPYTDEMFSTIFNRPLNTVRLALKILCDFGMIEKFENDIIKITNWAKHQNVEGMEKVRDQNRIRKQNQRARAKQLLDGRDQNTKECDSHTMSRDSHDIEGELEEEKEKEIYPTNQQGEISEIKTVDIVDNYNKNISTAGDEEKKLLKGWCKLVETRVVFMAIQEAINYNKKSIGYIIAVLSSWYKDGLKTADAVTKYKSEYKVKRDESKNNYKKSSKKKSSTTNFADYPQRQYDYDELERKLLGWDKKG